MLEKISEQDKFKHRIREELEDDVREIFDKYLGEVTLSAELVQLLSNAPASAQEVGVGAAGSSSLSSAPDKTKTKAASASTNPAPSAQTGDVAPGKPKVRVPRKSTAADTPTVAATVVKERPKRKAKQPQVLQRKAVPPPATEELAPRATRAPVPAESTSDTSPVAIPVVDAVMGDPAAPDRSAENPVPVSAPSVGASKKTIEHEKLTAAPSMTKSGGKKDSISGKTANSGASRSRARQIDDDDFNMDDMSVPLIQPFHAPQTRLLRDAAKAALSPSAGSHKVAASTSPHVAATSATHPAASTSQASSSVAIGVAGPSTVTPKARVTSSEVTLSQRMQPVIPVERVLPIKNLMQMVVRDAGSKKLAKRLGGVLLEVETALNTKYTLRLEEDE